MSSIPKRILFNTQFHWPYAPVDYSLSMALRARGHDVRMVACGGLPAYCERETSCQERPTCEFCLNDVTGNFNKYALPYYVISDVINNDDICFANSTSAETPLADLMLLEVKNVPVGRLAWLNLFQYFHGYPFEITGTREKVFRNSVNSGILIVIAADRIFNDYKPDMAITANGKFMQWAPFVYLAKQRGIPFITWEDLNLVSSGTIFALNEVAHEQRVDKVWKEECNKPLSTNERKQVYDHFKLWAKGEIMPFKFYDHTIEKDRDAIKRGLGLWNGRPLVSLFPNVCWDGSSVGFEGAFSSMFDWVFRVIDYAKKHPDIDVVVRAHPHESKIPDQFKSTTPICDEIRRRCSPLTENIKLVDGTSPISSYSLGEISDVVMVYTSTLGIEFALQGIRPWVIADAYYSGKGFTLDIKSRDDMIALLGNRHFNKSLSPEEIETAERFAHIVRFRRVFPFPYLEGASGKYTPPGLEIFVPGGNPVIDNLCDYVLTGRPFLDIGRPQAAEDYKEIFADDDLSNVKEIAHQRRFDKWMVRSGNFTLYCDDLLSFYMAAKDIFLNRIYDFDSAKPRPVVIDGGGHIGLFTLYAKKKYPGAVITVFEPDSTSVELLRKNIEANGIRDVKVIKAGLYKQDGKISFTSDNSDGGTIYADGKNSEIEVVRLSDYINTEVDFLKLNIEGAELDVLTEIEDKLPLVREMVIEYHGFPEIGQNLHGILAVLDRTGFRYSIHDFDSETNPATKPPFHIDKNTRFFLLIYAKRLYAPKKIKAGPCGIDSGHSVEPVSRVFGFDRGTPIDRYYIEKFLKQNSAMIRGRVLEIGDNHYTGKYGSGVTQSDVLNAVPSPNATIVGDLSTGRNIPQASFDCIIMTQTIQVIYDVKAALKNAFGALNPGGSLLLTASGISQISRYDMDRWGEYWRFTDKSLRMILSEIGPELNIQVESHGNVAVAKAFLDGLAYEELSQEVLDHCDKDYQVVLTALVRKPLIKRDAGNGNSKKADSNILFRTPAVLLYHRVADDPVDAQLLAVSPENFEAQLSQLTAHCRVLPLWELLEEAEKGVLNPNTVALTFDDGYLDVLTNAVPLLEKYRVHATVFVTSGMVGSKHEFWWDELERLFLTGSHLPESIDINFADEAVKLSLITPRERLKAHDEIAAILRTARPEDIDGFIGQLFNGLRLDRTGRSTHRVLDREQLLGLSFSPFIEIGSHSVAHPLLSALSKEEQRQEIVKSKEQLEGMLKRTVRLFSYPFGSDDSFSEVSERLVKEAGYAVGIANIQGSINTPVDLYSVPRILVRNWPEKEFSGWLREEDKGRLGYTTMSEREHRLVCYLTGQKTMNPNNAGVGK